MAIKIVSEVVLGLVLLAISSSFWNCVKSPKFLIATLGDYQELKKFFHHLGEERIVQESEKVDPQIGYSANIALCIKASVSALDQTRNMLLLVIIGVFVGSYFLGTKFLFINIGLFVVAAFPRISAPAQNNIFSDIHTIMLNVYKWNKVDHSECEHFCNIERPRYLKGVYRVITEE